jgi:hypothetical protein
LIVGEEVTDGVKVCVEVGEGDMGVGLLVAVTLVVVVGEIVGLFVSTGVDVLLKVGVRVTVVVKLGVDVTVLIGLLLQL